jgi:hypothetical protein
VEEETRDWGRLHIDERHDLYCSPNIIRVIESGRMRWARHVVRMGVQYVHTGFGLENREKNRYGRSRRRWEDDVKMRLLRNRIRGPGLDWSGSR